MHRRRSSLVVAVLLPVLAPGSAGLAASPLQETTTATTPAPQAPTFRSDVGLVLHSVAVLESDGRPVRGLAAHEFAVYEDGDRVDIELFLSPDESPLDIGVLLDSSRSLAPVASQVRRAARTFVMRLDPADCVYLLPFAGGVGTGTWARAADPLLQRRIEGITMSGGTALYDAILSGLESIHAANEPAAISGSGAASSEPTPETSARVACGTAPAADAPRHRRALVLLTDGADESSGRRFDEVLDGARAAGIPVFPVVLGEARRDPRLRTVLEALADGTGGRVIESLDPTDLERAYDDVVALLRASYLIGYGAPPAEAPRWREVSMRSRRPSYRLVHRERYFR